MCYWVIQNDKMLDKGLFISRVGFNNNLPVLNPSTSVGSFPIINSLPSDIRGINIGVISTGVGDDSIPNPQSPSMVADQP